jgi:tetratricopeptide (TPR) repeat protein
VASGGVDGTVRLWEAPSGRPLATLQGHTSAVFGMALRGDGGLLATASQDGTVRQYGLQQLERAGETAAVRDRHLDWCATLAERAAPALLGPEQAAWLARLDREHDNLRAALQWTLDRGLSTPGLRLAAGLWQFWRSRSHLSEGRRWLAALLALPVADDDAARMAVRASACEGAAWLTEDEHDFAQASALFAQSGALRRALGQDERPTGRLINAAMEARAGGDYARATALLEESLARQRAVGNRESIKRGGLGLALARLALVLAERGERTRATTLYEECLALHRELGDREGIGNALLGLGDLARDQGDTARVRAYCGETLALFRELGHTWVGFSLNNLALAAHLDGDLALAARRAAESAAVFRGLQAGPSLAEVLVTLGRIKGAQGEAVAARAHLAEALTLAGVAGPRFVVAAALEELGVQAVGQGQAEHGVHLLAAAAALRTAMGAPVRPADRPALDRTLAAAHLTLGDAAFTGAWATGQNLPLEQVVAHAQAAPEGPSDVAEPGSGTK